ncbi:MAG: hypothetical protein ABI867_11945 [Kofleriaceae bacterium]
MGKLAILLVALASCARAEQSREPEPALKPPVKPSIKVELAGVTLADDCPDGSNTKPTPPPKPASVTPTPTKPTAAAEAASQSMPSPGACADPSNCHGPPQPACEQTSMQLSVRAANATTIKIKQVELIDSTGKVVEVLTARGATRWETDKYIAWDEAVSANQDLVASYKLSMPTWTKFGKDRWNAYTAKFQLRVTVTVDGADTTIEKQSITPAMPEPAVAT